MLACTASTANTMTQRNRHFWIRVLLGMALGILALDVLALTVLIIPLQASQQRRATSPSPIAPLSGNTVEQALILPTRDARTPWPTKTLAPTATPWLTSPATPEPPPATPVLAESSTPPQSSIAMAMPVLTESTAPPQSAPVTPVPSAEASSSTVVETPTSQPTATLTIAPDTSADPSRVSPEASELPVDAPSETPADALTETPVDNSGETPMPPGTPVPTPGDLPDFETYLRTNRNTVAGQPLDILSLTMDTTKGIVPRFVLEVAGSETNNVFAAQSAADVLEYGRHLLDDAKGYLGDEPCAIAVESSYRTSNSNECSNIPAWCQVGAYDQSAGTWTVTRTYVRGSFADGSDTIEAWNTGK
jgi:hypothetical protein